MELGALAHLVTLCKESAQASALCKPNTSIPEYPLTSTLSLRQSKGCMHLLGELLQNQERTAEAVCRIRAVLPQKGMRAHFLIWLFAYRMHRVPKRIVRHIRYMLRALLFHAGQSDYGGEMG